MRVRHVLPEPGESFAGRYVVGELLARGGMAAVMSAREGDSGREVALKILYPHILTSAAAREGFEAEARLAARIGGPEVVAVVEAGVDPERELPFIAMERLEGETLGALVARRGALPPAEALALLRGVARGLDRAHAHVDEQGRPSPVVHRDLKPDNVFVTRDASGRPSVRLLDFGIAKVLREATTVTREVKGTPLYMSFEQAARSRVTPQTDLWAFGLVAFFLLTGRSYWRSSLDSDGSTIGLFAEVLSMPLPPASQRARELGLAPPWPPAFDAWFARCVCRSSRDRFASAGEAVRALAAALEGAAASPADLTASHDAPGAAPDPGASRRRPSGRALALGALLLGAASLPLVARSGPRPAPAASAAPPPADPLLAPPAAPSAAGVASAAPIASVAGRPVAPAPDPPAQSARPARRTPAPPATETSGRPAPAPTVNPYADR